MRQSVAALLVLVLAGCGGTAKSGVDDTLPLASSLPFAKSGQRLQALGYVAEGAEQFRTMHDSELGFDCDFVADAAGVGSHCVPAREAKLIFLDADCTQAATWSRGSIEVGALLSSVPTGFTCPADPSPHWDTYRLGPEIYPMTFGERVKPLYELNGGSCVSAATPGRVDPAVQSLTLVPESVLVAAHTVIVDVGGGLSISRLVADDGAALTVGISNAEKHGCALQIDGECVPGPVATQSLEQFSTALDSDCTVAAFASPLPSSCGLPEFGAQGATRDDFVLRRLERARNLYSREAVFPLLPNGSNGALQYTCEPANAGEYYTELAPGADVTGSFPTAERRASGSGALHVEWFVSKVEGALGGVALSRITAPTTFSTAEGQTCQVTSAADGTLRCAVLEPVAFAASYFADAACTERLYVGGFDTAPEAKLHVPEGRDSDGTALLGLGGYPLSALYDVEPYTGPTYALGKPGCVSDPASTPVYALGRKTEIADLPQVFEAAL